MSLIKKPSLFRKEFKHLSDVRLNFTFNFVEQVVVASQVEGLLKLAMDNQNQYAHKYGHSTEILLSIQNYRLYAKDIGYCPNIIGQCLN